MIKITLEGMDGNDPSKSFSIKLSDDTTYDELLSEFEYLLKGFGYHFDGHVKIVEEE